MSLDEMKMVDVKNIGKEPLQSSPLLKGSGVKDIAKGASRRKLTEDDLVMDNGMPPKGGDHHLSLGHITDENGDRKPKDFKEAISMASNRMIRKKQPSQDMTEPEMDGFGSGRKLNISKDEDHHHHHHQKSKSSKNGLHNKNMLSPQNS